MRGRISIVGTDILCECESPGANADIRIPLTNETLVKFENWMQTYKRGVRANDLSSFPEIGSAMFDWLDENGWASRWARGAGDRVLEVAVDDVEHDAACALLDVPWETLAWRGEFLAADAVQPFVVFRSIGRASNAAPAQPKYRDLALMFMAASPEGEVELDFEAEEAAILGATEGLRVQVVVEESGCADYLKDRLAHDGEFQILHVSCHGTILGGREPVLLLETRDGQAAETTPGQFAGVLGEEKPPLVFLSACRTAEARAIEPFVRALIRAGVPNVLGWDGSVYDADAVHFAKSFYGELAENRSVPFAAARGRRDLLLAHLDDHDKGCHWHMARVYAGPHGAGRCCDRHLKQRPLRPNAGYAEFLDPQNRRVPVAEARQFVGRRRKAQAVLGAFRKREKAGVLIFGMGNIGKSSLAARVANRMPRHETSVVWHNYDAPAIFRQLVSALPPRERAEWEQCWGEQIRNDGAALAHALEEMLEGPFNAKPILLVIDDLEWILDLPGPGRMRTMIKDAPGRADAWRTSIIAVLRAFEAANTESRLLLTSRYDFSLPDGSGRDLADALERVQLPSMKPNERAKQWQAAERTTENLEAINDDLVAKLAVRAQGVAGGNPGLQAILCKPILGGEFEAATAALKAIDRWKTSGEIPEEESAAQEFFRRVSFEEYRNALTEAECSQLRAGTLFSEGLPVPLAAIEAAGRALGVDDPQACIGRLVALGLVDNWGEIGGVEHAAVNPLARPLAGKELTESDRVCLAAEAIAPLTEAWQDEDGDFPFDPRGVETAILALECNTAADILESAAYAAGMFLFHGEHAARAALRILKPALAKIEKQGAFPRPRLLLLASNCAKRIGKIELQIDLLEKGLVLPSEDEIALARIAAEHAEATIARYGPEKSLETLRNVAARLKDLGDVRSRAVTMGKIADILQQQGQTDEALRIRKEEELPVYERLGDVRERAVTMGQIADILQQQGQTDEALRILTEDCLPAARELRDVELIAHIRFSCAQLRLATGGLERGEGQTIVDELAESFTTCMRLRRADGIAVVGWLLGRILAGLGNADEAVAILDQSAAACEKLKWAELAGEIRELKERIGVASE